MIPERANSLAVVEGVLNRFFQATAAAFHASCQVSENSELFRKLEPGARSNASESPSWTSQADPREDPKWGLPLIPDTVPFKTEKDHWTQEGCDGPYSIRGQTVLRPSAYVDLQLWSLTRRRKVSLAFRLDIAPVD